MWVSPERVSPAQQPPIDMIPGQLPEDGYRCAQDLRCRRNYGRTADSLPQAGQFGRKRGELDPQLLVLFPEWLKRLLLSKNQGYDASWSCQPDRLWNTSGGALITDNLCLRCNQDSCRGQGLSKVDVRQAPSRPLNVYENF